MSSAGRAWVATSTEGLLMYSLDHNLVFDPFDLVDVDVGQLLANHRHCATNSDDVEVG